MRAALALICSLPAAASAAGRPVTPVTLGQIIQYVITYTNCTQAVVKLVDSIPADTIYVPGSASGPRSGSP